MNLFKLFNKYIVLLLLCSCAIAATQSGEHLKVYVVTTYKLDQRIIERIFLKKENAVRYINTYSYSHQYELEEIKLTE